MANNVPPRSSTKGAPGTLRAAARGAKAAHKIRDDLPHAATLLRDEAKMIDQLLGSELAKLFGE